MSGYLYFPGVVGDNVEITLAVTTIYDYTVTYKDDTTATGTETSDGGGVLTLGDDQANFSAKGVKLIDVTADGGGATLAYIDTSALTQAELDAASFTATPGGTVTINGDEWAAGQLATTIAGKTVEMYLDANYAAGAMWFDRSGNDHHGQWGSAPGDTNNEPQHDIRFSDKFFRLPGTSGNFLSVPDSVAVSITGDIDLRAKYAMTDWTPATTQYVLSKWAVSGNERSWTLGIQANGKPVLYSSADGTAVVTGQATVATGFTDGETGWLRVTVDVDDGGGNRVYKFYTSTDGTTWTQLGTTVTTAGTTSFYDSTALVNVSGIDQGTNQPLAADLHEAQIYDGIDGTLALDVNAADAISPYATFTERSTNAATVTINRSASGYVTTVVDRGMLLFSTDDYVEIADADGLDFALADDMTVLITYRLSFDGGKTGLIGKHPDSADSSQGWLLMIQAGDAGTGLIGDGTNGAGSSAPTDPQYQVDQVQGFRRDTTADTLTSFIDGSPDLTPTTDPMTGTAANALPVHIGNINGIWDFLDGQVFSAVVFREALTDNEFEQASNVLMYGETRYPTGDLLVLGVLQ